MSTSPPSTGNAWPALPFDEWKDTCETLHRWTQIAGKIKLQLNPFLNQLWEVGLHVTARGLTSGLVPYEDRAFQIDFDLVDHHLAVCTSDGSVRYLALVSRSVADFYHDLLSALDALGITVTINTRPSEIPHAVPFPEDHTHHSYDAAAVQRFHRVLVQTAKVLQRYRSPFIGKSSPVLFYWGSFDLNQTRFSGEPATPPPGPRYYQLAEDEENIAAGFWPGNVNSQGVTLGQPAFYSYTAPTPHGFQDATVQPSAAHFDSKLGEFILPYEEARRSSDPAQTILGFFQSAYEAGARLAGWDRQKLERQPWHL